MRREALHVLEKAELLESVEVEVNKGNKCERPRDGDGAGCGFRTGDKADHVSEQDEEEQRSQEGNVLLVAFADNICTNAVGDEVVAIFENSRELLMRNELQLTCADEHCQQHQCESDEHIQRVLRDVPSANGKERRRFKVGI